MKTFNRNVILILFALFCSVRVHAHDFEAVNEDGVTIYYTITSSTDLTCAVSYRGDSYDSYSNEYTKVVNIPSSVVYNSKTYRVTSIEKSAFKGCSSLTSVTIPEGVTSIGDMAFDGCSGLTSVTIQESVTSIGSFTFNNCTSLTSITIPEGVTSIGDWAFYGCSGLSSVTIPNSITSIGGWAFYGCI